MTENHRVNRFLSSNDCYIWQYFGIYIHVKCYNINTLQTGLVLKVIQLCAISNIVYREPFLNLLF